MPVLRRVSPSPSRHSSRVVTVDGATGGSTMPTAVVRYHRPIDPLAMLDQGDASPLLYARGFLITRTSVPVPVPHWRQLRLGTWSLSYDPRNVLVTAAAGEIWVAVLGRALDLTDLGADPEATARSLLAARLAGRPRLQDAVDDLVGRFVVIDGDGAETYLQTDAAGMRSTFVAESPLPLVVAGHAALAAEVTGAERGPFGSGGWLADHRAYCLPGRATPYAGVVHLTPNTELHLEKRTVRRVFPRGEPVPVTVDDAVGELRELLQHQLTELAHRGPLMTSLTAGLDSRTTLALTRPVHESVRYFTYSLRYGEHLDNTGHALDLTTARDLAAGLGLDHQVVTVGQAIGDGDLKRVLERNSTRAHNRSLAAAYVTELPADRLHVRSNLFEIGRAFYRAQKPDRPDLTPEVMAAILCRRQPDDPAVVAEFAAFRDVTGLTEFAGYDPYDLFYWEHRSGVWLSAVYLESDIAHDTFTILNSRRIYRTLLGVPAAARVRGDVYHGLIRAAWPEVLEWPLNGRTRRPGQSAVPAVPARPDVAVAPAGPAVEAGPFDRRHRLPIHEHADLAELAVPAGTSRHRFALAANDERGDRPDGTAAPLELDAMLDARDSENLVVVFHGATDRSKYEYPRFEWQSTLAELDASVLYLADPILTLDAEITLGWYAGTAAVDVSRYCAELTRQVATRLAARRVIMTGTSGGGFAALAASLRVPGSVAVPFAPQTSVTRYYQKHVAKYLALAFPGHDPRTVAATFADRLDLTEHYAKATDNYVYYVQNLRDPFHIRDHLIPWAAAAGVTEAGGRSADGSRVVVLEDLREGHGPPPRPQFLEHVRKATEFLTQQLVGRTS